MKAKLIWMRRAVQLLSIPVLIWIAGKVGLLWVALVAIVFSLFIGRFFCGWMCPIGTVEELLGRLIAPKNPNAPYRVVRPSCRFGCPIAWVSGKINKISLLRIHKDNKKCIRCGVCDKSCPTGILEFGIGYKTFKKNPSIQYSCIRCLSCVGSCPKDALSIHVNKMIKDKLSFSGK